MPIVPMATLCYSGPIFIKLYYVMQTKYKRKVQSKIGCNILINKKTQPIVSMAAIQFIGSIGLLAKYIQRAAI